MLLRWLIITIITYTKVLFVSMLMLRICSYQLMIPLIDEYLVFFKSIRIDMKLVVYSIPLPPNPIELNWTKLNCLYSISVGFGVTSKIWLFSVQSKIFSQPGLNSINISSNWLAYFMLLMQPALWYIFFRKKQRQLISEVQDVTHLREL